MPSGDAEYRLDLTTARVSDDWRFGTGTSTSWTFRSDTTADPEKLPLLQSTTPYRSNAQNAVGPGRKHTVGLTVRTQDGMAAPHGVKLKVETSYDDGRNWTTARPPGGRRTVHATVERPSLRHGDAYVTLRVTAADAAGNSVRQTVVRAYLQRGTS